MATTRHAVVIGAGVIGLSTATRLREAGWDVRIRAERMPRDTTSMAAGALCGGGLAFAEPMDKVRAWGAATER